MKQKNDPKSKPKTPSDAKTLKGKDKKGSAASQKGEEKPEGEQPPIEEEKPKNIERFIHVTTYSDSEALRNIKELFEVINQKAFNLRSVKEIYTKNLTEEEQNNNEIDYISGIQLLDKDMRITILEGIAGKAMDLVKQKLPKTQMNTATFKIFSDSQILFNKRLYSKFDLSLKYIKLRDTLNHILTTFDIYCKAPKYREIYNTFMNYGSILNCQTLQEITNSQLFPDANSLLLLERKYADILSDEDMTGIPQKKKKKKRLTVEDLIEKMPNKSDTNTFYSGISDGTTAKEQKSQGTLKEISCMNKSSSNANNNQSEQLHQNQSEDEKQEAQSNSSSRMKMKPNTDSKNQNFDMYLLNHHKETREETMRRNFDYLKTMKKKINPDGHFCRPAPEGSKSEEEVYIYSQTRKNSYVNYVEDKRNKYIQDKNHFYTYSLHGLNLSFPLLTNKNQQYLDYLENKSKWIDKDGKNFDRYKQPAREKFFFPKINNIL